MRGINKLFFFFYLFELGNAQNKHSPFLVATGVNFVDIIGESPLDDYFEVSDFDVLSMIVTNYQLGAYMRYNLSLHLSLSLNKVSRESSEGRLEYLPFQRDKKIFIVDILTKYDIASIFEDKKKGWFRPYISIGAGYCKGMLKKDFRIAMGYGLDFYFLGDIGINIQSFYNKPLMSKGVDFFYHSIGIFLNFSIPKVYKGMRLTRGSYLNTDMYFSKSKSLESIRGIFDSPSEEKKMPRFRNRCPKSSSCTDELEVDPKMRFEEEISISEISSLVKKIKFDQNYFFIPRESFKILNLISSAMKNHRNFHFELYGFIDKIENSNLARLRAKSIRDYLILKGVKANRLIIKLPKNKDADGFKREVEIVPIE